MQAVDKTIRIICSQSEIRNIIFIIVTTIINAELKENIISSPSIGRDDFLFSKNSYV